MIRFTTTKPPRRSAAQSRLAWLLLAGFVAAVAAVGVSMAMIPEHQLTSCEVIDTTEACTLSTLDLTGRGAAAVSVLAAVLCCIPAVWARRNVAWGVVAALGLLGAVSMVVVGRIGIAVLTVALLAVAVAAAQERSHRRNTSKTERPERVYMPVISSDLYSPIVDSINAVVERVPDAADRTREPGLDQRLRERQGRGDLPYGGE